MTLSFPIKIMARENSGPFLVAQMLRSAGHKLYFFSSSSRTSAEDRMEIDFLIAKPITTGRHNISPVDMTPLL